MTESTLWSAHDATAARGVSAKGDAAKAAFLADVLRGLSESPKQIDCKYFYDERGSQLFDQICDLPEYYPTRVEAAIMRRSAPLMARRIGRGATLAELGSGSSLKTRILLDHLDHPHAYLPIDISAEHLRKTARSLRSDYPSLRIEPLVADFTDSIHLPKSLTGDSPVTVYFPGSTIGNFAASEAEEVLRSIAETCGVDGGLLIGIDLQKDPDVLEAAYNDAAGITADFNLNLLHRINRELGADFDVDQFRHVAVYDREEGRIEISLESRCDQRVTIDGKAFRLNRGERILTEYSHKYTLAGFASLARAAGFRLDESWTDPENFFAVVYLTVDGVTRSASVDTRPC